MSELLLLRHAKSSWNQPLADHERPLAPRGKHGAELIGEYLRDEDVSVDLVLCSSAVRTRETLARVAPGLSGEFETSVEDDLYGAAPRTLLERVRKIPDDVSAAMLIGHQPAMQALALELAGSGHDLDQLREKFPTAGLARLSFEKPWSELGHADAELIAFVRPRDLDA